MREYFQRVVDQIAGLSTQAQQVESLKQQVSDLVTKISNLEADNSNLRRALGEASNPFHRTEAELDSINAALGAEHDYTQSLRDTVVQRDSAVSELEASLTAERDFNQLIKAHLEDARQKIAEYEAMVSHLRDQVASLASERDRRRSSATEHKKQLFARAKAPPMPSGRVEQSSEKARDEFYKNLTVTTPDRLIDALRMPRYAKIFAKRFVAWSLVGFVIASVAFVLNELFNGAANEFLRALTR
jgi:chromosome segregation ATPase